MKKILLLCALLAVTLQAFAAVADLNEVYHQAWHNDPTIHAALAKRLADSEVLPQAKAFLLPNLGLNGDVFFVRRKHQFAIRSNGVINFGTHQFTLNLIQPIVNVPAWMAYEAARATVKQALATYNAAVQDLIIRVANAYFDILEAQDTLRFTRAEKRANARQLDQAQQRYKVGLDAITSVYEAKAAFDDTRAREIAAKNAVKNRREILKQITGVAYPDLAEIKKQLPLIIPEPNDMEAWVKESEHLNSNLQAARFALIAARENIKAAVGGHFPTINAISSYDIMHPRSPRIRNADQRTASIGVSLNFPIYEGEFVTSETRQARHTYDNAAFTAEEIRRSVVSSTRQAFNNIISGINIIKADQQAVISAQSSLESTEAAFKVGTRTIVDVLDRQKDLFNVQRRLALDQYNYIKGILLLKQAAGTLSLADLEEINTWLDTPHDHTTLTRFATKKYYPH